MTDRKGWSLQEDEALKQLVLSNNGKVKWTQVARQLQIKYKITGRSGKQCRQRWHNRLDPNIKTESWTHEEQELLFKYHDEYGNKWAKITQFLPGRTDNAIKNHFYSTLRKSIRRLNKFIVQNKLKPQFKQITNLMLYKLIAVVEDRFQNKHDVSYDLIQKCIQLKQKLLYYSGDIQIKTVEEQQTIKYLIRQILDFNKTHRKKKGKKKKDDITDSESESQFRQLLENQQNTLKKDRKQQKKQKIQPESSEQIETQVKNKSEPVHLVTSLPILKPCFLKLEDKQQIKQQKQQSQQSPKKVTKNLIVSGFTRINSRISSFRQQDLVVEQLQKIFPMSFPSAQNIFGGFPYQTGFSGFDMQVNPFNGPSNFFSLDLSGKLHNSKIMSQLNGSQIYFRETNNMNNNINPMGTNTNININLNGNN